MHASKASLADMRAAKREIVADTYTILRLHLGNPPEQFDWQWTDEKKKFHRQSGMTPRSFHDQYVTLPLLRPTILLVCVLTMISSFQVFDLIQVMTPSGGAQHQTRVLTIDIYENAFRFQRMGWSAAVSVALFLLVMVVTAAQFRLLRTDWEY